MCDFFIKNESLGRKQIFLADSLFKLTSRLDLLSLDEVMQDFSHWRQNGQALPLSSAGAHKLLRCLAAVFRARPLLNTHQGLKNPGLSSTLLNEQISTVQKFHDELSPAL